jgi:leucyl aminopeptidase
LAEATYLVRDLINIPAGDLGPDELAAVGVEIAKKYGAKPVLFVAKSCCRKIIQPFMQWVRAVCARLCCLNCAGAAKVRPKLSLVGKGVVFDTGGLDIKTNPYMLLMKKDMGGAAHALALAQLVMRSGLDVDLRVLCPMVENSVSATAMRPLDVVPTRAGKTIEIGNTDAEGRVILADCLYEAAQDKPDWLIDFATLTGAAAGALGPQHCHHAQQ